jgi:hypothetical protein
MAHGDQNPGFWPQRTFPFDLPRLGRQRTNFPSEVVEMALAHAVGDKVEAAYRRGDLFEKRRRLMAEWGSYCNTPVAGGRDKVIPMRGGR